MSEPIQPTRSQRAKALAQAARERIFRSFTNADASRAVVPFESARAEDCTRLEERSENEPAMAESYIRGRNHEIRKEKARRVAPA